MGCDGDSFARRLGIVLLLPLFRCETFWEVFCAR